MWDHCAGLQSDTKISYNGHLLRGLMTLSHPVTGDIHPLVVDRGGGTSLALDKPPRAFRHCIKPQFQSISDFIGIAAYMLD